MKLVDSYRTDSLTVANGTAKSDALEILNASVIGLEVPALDNGTLTVQVSNENVTSSPQDALFKGLVNQAGAVLLVVAASTGGFVLSGVDLAAVLPYRWLRVVCG